MRETNYDVAEAGVWGRGGAAQGAGARQEDGGHRHARSQLLFIFFPLSFHT